MKNFKILLIFITSLMFSQSKLPELNLSDINGKKINLIKDFAEKDKLYVFSFWATWCAPCINELDELNDLESEWHKTLNFEIIAVSVDDSRTQKRVKPLINGKGWSYKILLDTNQDLKRALTIVNVPYTVVVKNNKIVYIQNGYAPGNELDLFNKLKSL